jgi:hypothetical protein
MDYVSIVLDFANIVNLIAVLLLMRAVIKDRNVLRGFSISGTFLTFVAISCFEMAYFLMGNLISVALGLVSIVFWLCAFAFTLRKFLRERQAAHDNRARAS